MYLGMCKDLHIMQPKYAKSLVTFQHAWVSCGSHSQSSLSYISDTLMSLTRRNFGSGRSMETENEKKPSSVNEDFVCKKHVKFFKRCLDVLPSAYSSLDTSRFVHVLVDD